MPKRNYSNVAPPLPLGAAVTAAAVTLQVTSTTGYPAVPFILAAERGTANEEVMLCTAKTSTTFTVTRGYDGTAAVAHGIGAMIEHTVAAVDYREAGVPAMTTTERDALTGADRWNGMVVSNTTTNQMERWDGTEWDAVGSANHTHVIAALPVADDGEESADEVVRANDNRLKNARPPTEHEHEYGDIADLDTLLAANLTRIVHNGTAYPARTAYGPLAAMGRISWMGPTDPAAQAGLDVRPGDDWIQT